jgi:ABC-2 type transport system permease protein
MFKTIIKKELLESIFSYRFTLFLIICVILILSSLYVNYLGYTKSVSDYNEQLRLTNDAIASSRMWDVVSGSVPLKGFRRPSPLSVFAHGFESSFPRFYEFQSDGFKQGEASSGDESILSILGKFDFVFIVQMIVCLIVLLFSADLVSGEKEHGTLRGILSNSVPRHTLLLGKVLGSFIAVWLPLFVSFLCGVILLSLTSFPFFQTAIAGRVAMIFILTTLFLLTYFIIGIMISVTTARARTSLVVILLVWIVLQLIIPKVSDMVASIIYPIRTETVFSMQKTLTIKTLDEEKGKLLGQEWENIFGPRAPVTTNPEPPEKRDQWNAFNKDVEQRYRERKARELAAQEDNYRKDKNTQEAIASNLSLISPSAAFTRLITDICGTGEIARRKYVEAVKVHQQILSTQLYSHVNRTTMILSGGRTASTSSIGQMVDLKTLPDFSIASTTGAEVINSNLGSIISLVIWLIVPFAIAYRRFLRYDVR